MVTYNLQISLNMHTKLKKIQCSYIVASIVLLQNMNSFSTAVGYLTFMAIAIVTNPIL